RTYGRKMREALLARRLEQELCPSCGNDQHGKDKRKDKILELYLNHIYLGHGRYGIEEAARDNFGKAAKELTIAEAAMIAGIQAAPRKALRSNVAAYDKRHGLLAPLRAASVAQKGKGKPAKDSPPFEGTPKFESHKIFTGVVTAADDIAGTIDVRVGTVIGS